MVAGVVMGAGMLLVGYHAMDNTPDSASQKLDEHIRELGDWRGSTLKRIRELIHEERATYLGRAA